MGLKKIHFEGDAKSVVDAVNDVGTDRSSLGLVIEDIRKELNSLAMWKMTFIRREGNHVAHQLAKYVVLSGNSNSWCATAPACICEFFYFFIFFRDVSVSGNSNSWFANPPVI
jgi:hypothetical protein